MQSLDSGKRLLLLRKLRQAAYDDLDDEVKEKFSFDPERHTLGDIANFQREFDRADPDAQIGQLDTETTNTQAYLDDPANAAVAELVRDMEREQAGQPAAGGVAAGGGVGDDAPVPFDRAHLLMTLMMKTVYGNLEV